MTNHVDNFFVLQERPMVHKRMRAIRMVNKLLAKLGLWHRLTPVLNPMLEMNTLEHRINFYHLLTSVIDRKIPGDLVELGSFTGQCAMLFQKILNVHDCDKVLHLYDSFEMQFSDHGDIEQLLKKNFAQENLREPVIHKGNFAETLPAELPDEIAFAHIDCGWGGDPTIHKNLMLHCLEQLYPRLSKGAVCALMDYHHPEITSHGLDCNPGVKRACDQFLQDKPEKIISLYANQASHAYFLKV